MKLERNCRFVALISQLGEFRVGNVKSKQLANVLIKIIGLYVCLLAIPSVMSGLLAIFTVHMGGTTERLVSIFSYSIGAAVQILVGSILILKSRNLAESGSKMKMSDSKTDHCPPFKTVDGILLVQLPCTAR